MAENLGEAVLILRTDDSRFTSGVNQAGSRAKTLNRSLGRTARGAKALGGRLTALGMRAKGVGRTFTSLRGIMAGMGLALVVRSVVKTASSFQQLRLRLETVTGSAARAQKAFDGILEFATKTPFQVDNITEAFIQLKAIGIEPTDDLMRSIGNTASAFGKDITQFAAAVTGAVTGETERLKQFGITAKLEGDKVTFFSDGVATTLERNTKNIVGFLQTIGEVRFAGAMEKQIQSLDGAFSNLGDAMAQVMDAVGRGGLIDMLEVMTRSVEAFANESKDAAFDLGGDIVKAVETVALGTAGMIDLLTPIFDLAGDATKRLIDTFNGLPPWVQEIGVIGAILGGRKIRLLLLTLGVMKQEIDKVAAKLEEILPLGEIDLGAAGEATGTKLDGSLFEGGGSTAASDKVASLFDKIKAKIEQTRIEAARLKEEIAKLGDEPEQALKATAAQTTRAAAIYKETRTAAEEYAETLREVNELLAVNAISEDTANRKRKQAADTLKESSKENIEAVKDLGFTFESALEDAIVNTEKLSDVMRALGDDILRVVTRSLIITPLTEGLTGFLGGLFGSPAGATTSSAKGNVFSNGSVTPFARGGVINRPIAFPMKNGTGIAGEAGKEAIMPLSRTRGGALGVKSAGGGGVVVNIFAPPGTDPQTRESDTGNGGGQIDVMLDQAVAKNIRPGTRTFQQLQRAFTGLSPRTVAR